MKLRLAAVAATAILAMGSGLSPATAITPTATHGPVVIDGSTVQIDVQTATITNKAQLDSYVQSSGPKKIMFNVDTQKIESVSDGVRTQPRAGHDGCNFNETCWAGLSPYAN